MEKTVEQLLKEGAQWIDARWKDFLKTPDGIYWKASPHERVSMPVSSTKMVATS